MLLTDAFLKMTSYAALHRKKSLPWNRSNENSDLEEELLGSRMKDHVYPSPMKVGGHKVNVNSASDMNRKNSASNESPYQKYREMIESKLEKSQSSLSNSQTPQRRRRNGSLLQQSFRTPQHQRKTSFVNDSFRTPQHAHRSSFDNNDSFRTNPQFFRKFSSNENVSQFLDEQDTMAPDESPPPPPPPQSPPPPFYEEEEFVSASHIEETPLTASSKYVEHITDTARKRKQKLMANVHLVANDKIKALERKVRAMEINQDKLLTINTRLQERLVVFQEQNAKNVQIAKDRIHLLQEQLLAATSSQNRSIPRAASQSDTTDTPKVPEPENRQLVLYKCFFAWKWSQQVASVTCKNMQRKNHELVQRIFRHWACAGLLAKIIQQAMIKQNKRIAQRCFQGWKQHAKQQQIRNQNVIHYFHQRVRFRMISDSFQQWVLYYTKESLVKHMRWFVNMHLQVHRAFLGWKIVVLQDSKHQRDFESSTTDSFKFSMDSFEDDDSFIASIKKR